MPRAVLLVIALVGGCAAHRTSGPSWPKMAEHASDGGESLAPHSGAIAIAAASGHNDDDDIKVVVAPTATTPAAAAATTPAAAPTTTSSEDPLTVEEITIEISDD